MDTCTFNLNIQGTEKVFYSEKDLNDFLQKYYHVLSSGETLTESVLSKVTNGNPLNRAEVTYYKLQKFSENVKDVKILYGEDGERIDSVPKRKSITQITREIAESDPNSGLLYFSTDKYIQNRRKQVLDFVSTPDGLKSEEFAKLAIIKQNVDYKKARNENFAAEEKELETLIMEKINTDVANWSKLAGFGTNVHALAESYFKYKLDPKNNGSEFTVLDFPSDVTMLSDGAKRNYLDYMNTLYVNLQKFHGQGSIMIPEYKILDEETNIVGVIDLLVIDSKGVSHIYDFKTSYKEHATWHEAKKLTYTYQLGAYKNMLKNKGIEVGDTAIIPLMLENIDYGANTIERVGYAPIIPITYSFLPVRFINRINRIIPLNTALQYESSAESTEVATFLKEALDYNISLKTSLTDVDGFIKKYVQDSKKTPGYKAFHDYAENTYVEFPEEKTREEVEAYFKRDAANSSSALMAFKGEFNRVMNGELTLESMSIAKRSSDRRTKGAVTDAFRKYTIGSWKLIMDDPILDQLGLLMFVNEQPDGKNTVEFVSYTTNDLSNKVPLNGRNSILGKFASDSIGETYPQILPSTNGNIELIKVLAYVDANNEMFKKNEYNLGRIIAFNRNSLEFHTENLERLKYNFDFLTRKMGRANNIVSINTASKFDLLADTFNALKYDDEINGVTKQFLDGALTTLLDKKDTGKLEKLRDLEFKLREILIAKRQMKTLADFNTPEKLLYAQISEAITQEEKRPLTFEQNMKEFVRLTSSPGDTPSNGANLIHGIMEGAMQSVRTKQLDFRRKSRVVADEFLNEQGYPILRRNTLGDISGAYNNMFRKVNGKVDGRLILKDPYDPSSSLTPNERKFAKYFLENINSYRWGTSDPNSDIGKVKVASGEWFELPLMRGNTFNKMFQRNVKQKIVEYVDTLLDSSGLFDVQKDEYNKRISEGMYEINNTFDMQRNPADRDKLIQSENLGAFETDMEIILDFYKFSEIRKKEYDKIMPSIVAMKIAMAYQAYEVGIDLSNTLNYINKQTEHVLYGRVNILQENQVLMKMSRTLRDVATFGNMALNPVSGVTNFMTGLWGNISRLMSRNYGKDMFTYAEFSSAFGYVMRDSIKSVANLTWMEELNMLYGLNGMDMNRLHERMMQNRSGMLNFGSKQLYWLMSAPDYFNRMVLFIAQMKHDGCFEAHTLVDGQMVYDFKKDKRFSVYNSKNVNHPDYNTQKALYNAIREDFLSEGIDLKEGDPLPMAYNNKQRNSMKDFADSIHGHYDSATKAQYTHTVLGSLFGQFKTWMVAKKNQYILGTIESSKQGDYVQYEVDGVKYYMGADGQPTTENTGDPILIWRGRTMEGILISLVSMFNELKQADDKASLFMSMIKDPFKDDPDHPVRASNLKLLASDLGIVLAVFLLFGLIDMDDLERDEDFSYRMLRAFMRSSQDLNPAALVGTVLSGKPIASLSYISDVSNSFWKVVTGDEKFAKFLFSNTGMTRLYSEPIMNALYPNGQ